MMAKKSVLAKLIEAIRPRRVTAGNPYHKGAGPGGGQFTSGGSGGNVEAGGKNWSFVRKEGPHDVVKRGDGEYAISGGLQNQRNDLAKSFQPWAEKIKAAGIKDGATFNWEVLNYYPSPVLKTRDTGQQALWFSGGAKGGRSGSAKPIIIIGEATGRLLQYKKKFVTSDGHLVNKSEFEWLD